MTGAWILSIVVDVSPPPPLGNRPTDELALYLNEFRRCVTSTEALTRSTAYA